MELTPGEEVIVNLLRGEHSVDFVLNVAWLGPVWTVSISSEVDGILAGRGDSFRQALHAAFGVVAGEPEGEGTVKAVMRLVADNTAPQGSMRRTGSFRRVEVS